MGGWRFTARSAALPLVLAAGLVTFGERDGGYFPPSWGWAACAALIGCIGLVLLGPVRLTRLELAFVGGLAGVLAWTALSGFWTSSFSETMHEVERGIVYPAALLGALLGGTGRRVALAVYAASLVLALHGLFQRLVPDLDHGLIYGDGRLSGPVTYSNAFGLIAVVGVLLAVGFVLGEDGRLAMAAAASVTPLMLALYFTFSRGSWAALAVGLVVLLTFAHQRASAAVLSLSLVPVPALAIWLASRSVPLSTGLATQAQARDGHRLAAAVVGLSILGALIVPRARSAARRIDVPARVARIAAAAAAIGMLVIAGAAAFHASAIYHSFAAGSSGRVVSVGGYSTYDPRARLFSIQGNQRAEYWRVALVEFRAHPLLGSGAGTYDVYWLRDRRNDSGVHDAHSLYLETLGELGAVGLLLLVAVLSTPLVAAARSGRQPLVAAAAAAYSAYLVHTGLDWDWELPAVTLVGLLAGAAVLLALRRSEPSARGPGIAWALSLLGLLAFSACALLGATAVQRAGTAAAHGNWVAADAAARIGTTWTPWDSEGWRLRAEAALSRGDVDQARAALRAAIARDH